MYSFEMSMFLQYIIIAQKDERGMNHLWSKCVLRLNVFCREGIFLTGKGKVWYNVYGGDSKLLFSGQCPQPISRDILRGEGESPDGKYNDKLLFMSR